MSKPFYKLSAKDALKELGVSLRKGLSEEEIESRREKHGANELPRKKSFSTLKIIIDQIKSPLIYILIIAGIIVLFFEDYPDAIVIFGAVLLNTVVGYIQESKASKALAHLREVIKIKVRCFKRRSQKNHRSEGIGTR